MSMRKGNGKVNWTLLSIGAQLTARSTIGQAGLRLRSNGQHNNKRLIFLSSKWIQNMHVYLSLKNPLKFVSIAAGFLLEK